MLKDSGFQIPVSNSFFSGIPVSGTGDPECGTGRVPGRL